MAIGDGLRALVLEDDLDVQLLIVKVLSAHGFRADAVADGLEGLVRLETAVPDLIVCDVMMPRLDGLTFAKAIKATAGSKEIPIIFVTAKNDVTSVVEGM